MKGLLILRNTLKSFITKKKVKVDGQIPLTHFLTITDIVPKLKSLSKLNIKESSVRVSLVKLL